MSRNLRVNDVLDTLDQAMSDNAPAERTASRVSNSNSVKTAKAKLEQALAEVQQEVKVAARAPERALAASPVGDMEKISAALHREAAALVSAEKEASIKEAQLMGMAMVDGMVSRLNMFEQAGDALIKEASGGDELEYIAKTNPELFNKIASVGAAIFAEELGVTAQAEQAPTVDEAALTKQASENPAQFAADVEAGYIETFDALEKLAMISRVTGLDENGLTAFATQDPSGFAKVASLSEAELVGTMQYLQAQEQVQAALAEKLASISNVTGASVEDLLTFAETDAESFNKLASVDVAALHAAMQKTAAQERGQLEKVAMDAHTQGLLAGAKLAAQFKTAAK